MSRRVLVIDDDHDMREVVTLVLRERGYDVREAEDGPAGIAVASEWRPMVVLVDIGLPGMDGYEVARRLRRLQVESMRLVALTGYGLQKDCELALDAGFDVHVVKATVSLYETLEELMSGTRRR